MGNHIGSPVLRRRGLHHQLLWFIAVQIERPPLSKFDVSLRSISSSVLEENILESRDNVIKVISDLFIGPVMDDLLRDQQVSRLLHLVDILDKPKLPVLSVLLHQALNHIVANVVFAFRDVVSACKGIVTETDLDYLLDVAVVQQFLNKGQVLNIFLGNGAHPRRVLSSGIPNFIFVNSSKSFASTSL